MSVRPLTLAAAAAFVSLCLSGCTALQNTAAPSPITSAAQLSGSIHGGQAPIANAHIHLMAASAGGFGSASTSLLNPALTGHSDSIGAYVLSGPTGAWSISTDYTCTSGQIVYLLGTEGNPGLPDPNADNTSIALMAVLGVCPGTTFSSALTINLDEATTVAGAYALSGFMTDATHLASDADTRALNGIANAAANAAFLVDLSTGKPLATTPNGLATVPQSTLSALSNILAYCINSDGTTNCSSLFALSKDSGGNTPTDTLKAILNIAHNPGANTTALFNLTSGIGDPFPNALTSAPNDWSITLSYAIPSTVNATRSAIAIDSAGNLWLPSSTAGARQVSPAGAILVTASANKSYDLAVSTSNDSVWGAGNGGLYSGNSQVSDTGTSFNHTENLVTFDASGNPYFTSFSAYAGNNYVWSKYVGGGYDSSFGYLAGGQQNCAPSGTSSIALDSQSHIWVVCNAAGIAAAGYGGGGLNYSVTSSAGISIPNPSAVAIDSQDNAWITDKNCFLERFDKTAATLATFPSTAIPNCFPGSFAFDGSGTAWIAGAVSGSQTLFGITSTGSYASAAANSGYVVPSTGNTLIAVDNSGNVWQAGTSTLLETIGVATPVYTPTTPGHLAALP